MKIIVDAYNVLHAKLKQKKITESDRKQFINQLHRYAERKGNDIIVVFDGGPYLFVTTLKEVVSKVTIMYSGPKETADDLIVQYVRQHIGHEILLVSSDRELCKIAQQYKVDAIEATYFYDYIITGDVNEKEKGDLNDNAFKMGNADSMIDLLMLQTVVQKKAEDIDSFDGNNKQLYRSSKKKRSLIQKLKKL